MDPTILKIKKHLLNKNIFKIKRSLQKLFRDAYKWLFLRIRIQRLRKLFEKKNLLKC